MTQPLGTADFFALEAGECLNRLEALVIAPGGPAPDEFVRMARALRGSALMAQQRPIAEAAAGLEAVAKAVRERRRLWDPVTAEQVTQAIDTFRHLVRRTREWADADTARAAQLAAALETLAGSPSGTPRTRCVPGEPLELNPGVRAFVAREGALIASALDRAARALQGAPETREPLYAVLRRMQPLRGLAELGDLSPLPDILDGVELAVGDLSRIFAAPPRVYEVLDAAAHALTRVCREVAERGHPTPDSEEARRFTDLLLRAFATESDVVPIESLFYAGDTEPMRRTAVLAGTAPVSLGPLELVSQGEHFAQTAEVLRSAGSATERDLRLYGLAAALRPLGRSSGGVVADGLSVFAQAARERIADGAAARAAIAFADALVRAGTALRAAAEPGDIAGAVRGLTEATQQVHQLGMEPEPLPVEPTPPPAPPPPAEPATVPIESLAYDGESVFADERPIVPIESLAPEPAVASPALSPFERALSRYWVLVGQDGLGPASLDLLVGAVTAPVAAAPVATPEPVADVLVVEIGAICYSGRGALLRAVELRGEIAAQLVDGAGMTAIEPLLQELLDLVPLALDDA